MMSGILAETDRVRAMDGLRGLAVMEVVGYHMGVWGCTAMFSRLVMTFFFIVSGFFMMKRYGGSNLGVMKAMKHILMRRMGSFLPLYWLTLVPIVLFSEFGVRWDLPFHIFLMQSWIPGPYYAFSYNQAAWFMSSLLACYVCFPLMAKAFGRLSLCRGAVLLVAFAITYFITVACVVNSSDGYVYYIFPITRMIEFAAGMMLYRFLTWYRTKDGSRSQLSWQRATSVELCAMAVTVACVVGASFFPLMPGAFQFTLLWYLPAMMLIAVFTGARLRRGVVARLLSSKWPVMLGRLSMEIYIVHYLTLVLTRKALEAVNVSLPLPLHWLLALLVTLLTACVAHRLITVPVKQWMSGFSSPT